MSGARVQIRRALPSAGSAMTELLEAAHILPDGHPLGEPVIPNGLALCTLRHAAFGAYIIGVTPHLEVTVRLDCYRRSAGRCSCTVCWTPAILAERYAFFRRAS